MRNMSFMLTTEQVRAGTKTVTRRLGWWNLKPGELVQACVKCQGLGKGGQIERIRVIRIKSTRRERLSYLLVCSRVRQLREVEAEGFPDLSARQFVAMFCAHMDCTPDTEVNRIEFEYVEEGRIIHKLRHGEPEGWPVREFMEEAEKS